MFIMPTFEMICLAKSSKRGGICIAGLKTDGSGWLRPVSPCNTPKTCLVHK
jgi:hypothetical protein